MKLLQFFAIMLALACTVDAQTRWTDLAPEDRTAKIEAVREARRQRIRVDPCSVSVVDYTPLRPFVARTNDTGGGLEGFAPKPARKRRRRTSDAAVGGGAGA